MMRSLLSRTAGSNSQIVGIFAQPRTLLILREKVPAISG